MKTLIPESGSSLSKCFKLHLEHFIGELRVANI